MNDFKRLAHAVLPCRYHVLCCSKCRFRILQGEVGRSVRDIIRQLCIWSNIEILEGNTQFDHIHLVLSIPPKYSVSEAVGFLKGKSAIKIFDFNHELKKRYWGRHFWSKGYRVSTIGLDEEQIRKYIRYQLHKDKVSEQTKLW